MYWRKWDSLADLTFQVSTICTRICMGKLELKPLIRLVRLISPIEQDYVWSLSETRQWYGRILCIHVMQALRAFLRKMTHRNFSRWFSTFCVMTIDDGPARPFCEWNPIPPLTSNIGMPYIHILSAIQNGHSTIDPHSLLQAVNPPMELSVLPLNIRYLSPAPPVYGSHR